MRGTSKADNWSAALLPSKATVEEAIANLENSGLQIVLCVEENNKLSGTLTDGDIRRGLSEVTRSTVS